MTWSGPETRHVAAAAARWVPSAFLLLKEYCRTGSSEASLEAVKVGGRKRKGGGAGGEGEEVSRKAVAHALSPPPLALHYTGRGYCARARPSTCGCTQTSR